MSKDGSHRTSLHLIQNKDNCMQNLECAFQNNLFFTAAIASRAALRLPSIDICTIVSSTSYQHS